MDKLSEYRNNNRDLSPSYERSVETTSPPGKSLSVWMFSHEYILYIGLMALIGVVAFLGDKLHKYSKLPIGKV